MCLRFFKFVFCLQLMAASSKGGALCSGMCCRQEPVRKKKLVEMVRRVVPHPLYGECFVIYHEQVWRRQQKNFVQVRRAFPGYVFITSREPEALFFA